MLRDCRVTGVMESKEMRLQALDVQVEDEISDMRHRLEQFSQDPYYSSRLYVTRDDICNLKCFKNDALFAIHTPCGTTIEVPDPTDGQEAGQKRYR